MLILVDINILIRGESFSWSWYVSHSVTQSHFSISLFYIAPIVPYDPIWSH